MVVSEHKDLILDCLKDDDVTIRHRALDLVSAMVSKRNLAGIVRRLMEHLNSSDGSYRYPHTTRSAALLFASASLPLLCYALPLLCLCAACAACAASASASASSLLPLLPLLCCLTFGCGAVDCTAVSMCWSASFTFAVKRISLMCMTLSGTSLLSCNSQNSMVSGQNPSPHTHIEAEVSRSTQRRGGGER